MDQHEHEGPLEIALVGDLTDNEADLTDKLLGVAPGGKVTMYIDSPGGSPYCAMSLMSLIMLRGLRVTGVVTVNAAAPRCGRSPLYCAGGDTL